RIYANFHFSMGHHHTVLSTAQHVLSIASSDIEMRFLEASCLHAMGRWAEVVREYNDLMSLAPPPGTDPGRHYQAFYQYRMAGLAMMDILSGALESLSPPRAPSPLLPSPSPPPGHHPHQYRMAGLAMMDLRDLVRRTWGAMAEERASAVESGADEQQAEGKRGSGGRRGQRRQQREQQQQEEGGGEERKGGEGRAWARFAKKLQ
ncbi:unnamed protein product, partial [Closterium sp. Naga37s-1]